MRNQKIYSLVLGGYVNGYTIIRELYEKGLRDIALFSYDKVIAYYSNKVAYKSFIDFSAESLKAEILKLKNVCDYIVVFPTDDVQLENLYKIKEYIEDFCFIPFNSDNIIQTLDKSEQYKCCAENDIPYPKSIQLHIAKDLDRTRELQFPILIKPLKREDITTEVFRNLFIENFDTFNEHVSMLNAVLDKRIGLLASEFVPGDDTNIFAYVGYRSKNGKILNEWIGKKLTQFPDEYGIFSSASNQAPEVVKEQGRILLEKMNLFGICEPEFKYDIRDGKYKLMEINLRSMMWHRVGNKSGVNLQYSQYLDAIGLNVPMQMQNQTDVIHFVYMRHELLNLINRKGYWKHFKNNVFSGRIREFAIYDKDDLRPFIMDSLSTTKSLIGQCLRKLKIR